MWCDVHICQKPLGLSWTPVRGRERLWWADVTAVCPVSSEPMRLLVMQAIWLKFQVLDDMKKADAAEKWW